MTPSGNDRPAISELRSPRGVKGNRLIRIEPVAATPNDCDKKTELDYDYVGRRVRKQVSEWDDGQSIWVQTLDRKFVRDGWLLLLELNGTNGDAVIRKYTWGLDLSGQSGGSVSDRSGLEGAGGIGGLLAIHDENGSDDYAVFHDRMGNVGQLVDISDGTTVAKYEYDAYGNVVWSDGAYDDENPIRFSTKYFDDETGLGYWGYRYYSPTLGRWLNRDPLEEDRSVNLSAYVGNQSTTAVDPLGDKTYILETRVRWAWHLQAEYYRVWGFLWLSVRDAELKLLNDTVHNLSIDSKCCCEIGKPDKDNSGADLSPGSMTWTSPRKGVLTAAGWAGITGVTQSTGACECKGELVDGWIVTITHTMTVVPGTTATVTKGGKLNIKGAEVGGSGTTSTTIGTHVGRYVFQILICPSETDYGQPRASVINRSPDTNSANNWVIYHGARAYWKAPKPEKAKSPKPPKDPNGPHM